SGISKRVAETTTDSASASLGEAVGVASCAQQTTGAKASIATGKNQTGRFCITSFLQLRESDLFPATSENSIALESPTFDEVAGSPSSHSSFCEEVFSRVGFCSGVCVKRRAADTAAPTTRMRWTGQIFWLLASDACVAPHLPPAFTPEMASGIGPMGSRIQLQQCNCSRFSRDFLRRSTFSNSQRTESRTSCSRSPLQELFISRRRIADPGVRSSRRLPAFFLRRRKLEGSHRVSRSE